MTFARLAKLVAVLLVALALWQVRRPVPPARVVVLALPGAAADVVAPVGGELRTGEIQPTTAISAGGTWWRRLFARNDGVDSRLLWEGEDAAARPLAVPSRLLRPREQLAVVENGFAGSSSGAVVDAVDITSGRLPAPYDRAIDAVAAAAANLPRDQWSEWIQVAPAAAGQVSAAAEFQFTHYTDSSYFFSPAYVLGPGGVVGSPFLRGLDRSLRPLVSTHVIELARRRIAPARQLFQGVGHASAVVAFNAAVEGATAVFSPDSIPAVVLERAGNAVSADLAMLREVVGDEGLVLVLGGPPSTRQAVGSPWYRLVQGGKGGMGGEAAESKPSLPIQFEAARAMVRYVTGVALTESERNLLPSDLVTRFPIRPIVTAVSRSADEEPPARSWTVEAIESVPGAVD